MSQGREVSAVGLRETDEEGARCLRTWRDKVGNVSARKPKRNKSLSVGVVMAGQRMTAKQRGKKGTKGTTKSTEQ